MMKNFPKKLKIEHKNFKRHEMKQKQCWTIDELYNIYNNRPHKNRTKKINHAKKVLLKTK